MAAASACTGVSADARTFEGTRWTVTAINGQATPPGLTVSFSRGQLGGYLGCNQFSGPYRTEGQVMTVRPIAVTQMACEPVGDEPRPMFEPAGLAVLAGPMRMTWQSGAELTLSNAAGSIVLKRAPDRR